MQARIDADHEYLRVGLEDIRSDPARWAWGRITRGSVLLWAAEIPVRYSDINRLPPAVVRLLWIAQGLLFALAVVGAIGLARTAPIEVGAIAALVLYVSAVHVPMYSEARYSLPAKPLMMLLVAAAVAWMSGGLNRRRGESG